MVAAIEPAMGLGPRHQSQHFLEGGIDRLGIVEAGAKPDGPGLHGLVDPFGHGLDLGPSRRPIEAIHDTVSKGSVADQQAAIHRRLQEI
jgi:hypothetical protein